MSPPCAKTLIQNLLIRLKPVQHYRTYIGTPCVKIKEYRENVQECFCNQEPTGFFLETKLLINYPGSGNSHISIWTKYIARGKGYETLGLAVWPGTG